MPHTHIKRGKDWIILLLDLERTFALRFYPASLSALNSVSWTGLPGDKTVISAKAPKAVPGAWLLYHLTQSASPVHFL